MSCLGLQHVSCNRILTDDVRGHYFIPTRHFLYNKINNNLFAHAENEVLVEQWYIQAIGLVKARKFDSSRKEQRGRCFS